MAENQTLNIYQKLAQIRRSVAVLQKNKSGYGYRYVTEDEILAKVTAGMNKHNVSLVPGIVSGTMKVNPYSYKKTKGAKGGNPPIEETVNEILIDAEMTWTWVNDECPEQKVVVPWMLVGQQGDAAQAFGSGLTYTTRYFLLKYFQVATTEDDPDNYRSKQKSAEVEGEAAVAAEIVKEIDTIVQSRIKQMSDDDKKKLLAEIQKVVKINGKQSANYNAIKDPQMAIDTLDAIKKYFKIEVQA